MAAIAERGENYNQLNEKDCRIGSLFIVPQSIANLPRSKEGAQLLLFVRPALLPYGKRGFRAAICKIACPQPPLAALLIRSGGVYGARSSRQAASYVIFCP